MIPTFTIVTTLITIGVTALLISILIRINNPQRRKGDDNGGAPLVFDGGGSGRSDRQNPDADGGGSDGGGDGSGGD